MLEDKTTFKLLCFSAEILPVSFKFGTMAEGDSLKFAFDEFDSFTTDEKALECMFKEHVGRKEVDQTKMAYEQKHGK